MKKTKPGSTAVKGTTRKIGRWRPGKVNIAMHQGDLHP